MRVLDLGCGAGDVSLLAAEMVGPTGAVTGVDRNANSIAEAQARADAAGYVNVKFIESDVTAIFPSGKFDLAVGRFVLIPQPDPVALIRSAASHVRSGGVVAFQEPLIDGNLWCYPPVPLWKETTNLITAAFKSALAHPDAGAQMIKHFHAAGLPEPFLFSETLAIGGSNSPLCAWMAELLRSLLPQAERAGLVKSGEIDIDSLGQRLRQAVAAVHGQIGGPHLHCGWSRV